MIADAIPRKNEPITVSENFQISDATYLEREPTLVASEIDGEIVILEMSSGQYYSLKDTGAFLWREIEAMKSVGQLIDRMQERYDIDRDTCREDVTEFSKMLIARKLWRTAEPA
jgi:Coenzyme PQQ synthesis protein D (PqqD)